MSNYRLEISNSLDLFDVVHFSGKDFYIDWKKDEGFKADYNMEIPEITFIKEDFEYFLDIERNGNQCDTNTINIYQKCGNSESLRYTGTFNMSNGKWDLDRCKVTFKAREKNDYRCIDENEDETNFLEIEDTYTAEVKEWNMYIELYLCDLDDNDPTCDESFLEDEHLSYVDNIGAFGVDSFAVYARFVLLVPCDFVATDDWILYDDCTDGVRKYIKPIGDENGTDLPPFSFANRVDDGQGSLWVYPGFNTYPLTSEIDNGRKLYEVMQYLLNAVCDGYNIVSDFFQWNPENETSINYVTGETNPWRNILIFQKSDVKRPGVSNNATIAKTYFKELLENICGTFNLRYIITDDVFRLEHISFFQNSTGMNLITQDSGKLKNMLKGSRKYEYDRSKLYKKETFQFMHEIGSLDFVGVDILYDCSDEFDLKEKENRVEDIFTDVMACLTNYSADNSLVSDDGFVLIACDTVYNDGNYDILSVDGILDTASTPNNVLGWAYLHDKLWRDGRYYKSGEMNNEATEFTNINPYYKQDAFSVILSCNHMNSFNPVDKIKAMLGWGFIDSARYSLDRCSMEFNLLLQEIQDVNTSIDLGDFDSNFDNDFD